MLKLPEFLANASTKTITNDRPTTDCPDFPREMRAFAASKPVQIAALPMLITIAACATRTNYFCKSLACVLVHVMQAQPHDEEVQQCACEAVCTISPLYQEQLLDAGAVPVVVKAMMRFAPSPKAVGALSRMMAIYKGVYGARIAADVQGSVIDAGVVPLLVTAMTQQDNRDFIAACVDCLCLLPTSHADLLVQAGVADSLFAILRANSEAAAHAASQIDLAAMLNRGSLTQKVLELLVAMQKHERYWHIDFFATSAGMEACLAHAHAHKGYIAWNVLTLVEHMAARHTHVMFAVIHLGLVPLLLAVLKRGHETAVKAALRLLHKLSTCAQFSPLVHTSSLSSFIFLSHSNSIHFSNSLSLSLSIYLSLSLYFSLAFYVRIFLFRISLFQNLSVSLFLVHLVLLLSLCRSLPPALPFSLTFRVLPTNNCQMIIVE